MASLNYLLTSHVWQQDHNGFSVLSKNGTSVKKGILKTPEIAIKLNANRLYVPIILNSLSTIPVALS
ncbi:hypothetical protein CK510_29310 [Brunnivagina elsteri CCALA 953]|uniref:Uncharacterized protein n=1 Tax=Brunnivagina elsteri CCALA 953 TaxID=987040 RepID=A0A2A2TA98_9CYAN|nr:hypothetical protein CK510_29310 [Calothrix elsteri CCALA 953]